MAATTVSSRTDQPTMVKSEVSSNTKEVTMGRQAKCTEIEARRHAYEQGAAMLSPSHLEALRAELPGQPDPVDDERSALDPTRLVPSGIATAAAMTRLRRRLDVTDERQQKALAGIGHLLTTASEV